MSSKRSAQLGLGCAVTVLVICATIVVRGSFDAAAPGKSLAVPLDPAIRNVDLASLSSLPNLAAAPTALVIER